MREMKDSCIDGIGNIPVEWEIVKTKYVADLYTGNSIKDEEKDNYTDAEDAVPYIATKDIAQGFNSIDYTNGLYVKNKDNTFVRAFRGSSLMCIEGGSAGRKKAFLDREVCFVNKLCCFKPGNIKDKYLYYYLNSPHYEEEFKQCISGLIGGVSKTKLENMIVVKPTIVEQERIVDYLDRKCAAIDNIITKQEQIIERLKEYKLSLITEAVTKGLDPNVEMRESAVEWIGKLPSAWSIGKIGSLFDFVGGYAFNSDDYVSETDYQVVRIGNVKNDNMLLESNPVYVSEETAEAAARFEIKEGYILFTMTGTKGKRDYFYTCLVGADELCNKRLFINQRVGAFVHHKDVCAGYYKYLFKEKRILDSIFLYETGTANQGNLGIDTIKRTKVQIPPYNEQCLIAEYLDDKCTMINKEIEHREYINSKLLEYKKSLIYEVVTGKKEV